MVEKMEEMAVMVKKSSQFSVDRRLSFGKHFGRPQELRLKDLNNYLNWIGETYYFPSNDERRKSVLTDIELITSSDVMGSKLEEEKEPLYDKAEVDEWGFIPVAGGKYYNTLRKEYFDKHPLIE